MNIKEAESSQHLKEIAQLIEELNDCWVNERLEDLPQFFHRQAVEIRPGTTEKISGQKAIVDNYRDFVEISDVMDFEITDMVIDIFDSTAIALYSFRILYRVETTNYDENVREILVLDRQNKNDQWLVVWRTQLLAS
jgi:hypothetical protein